MAAPSHFKFLAASLLFVVAFSCREAEEKVFSSSGLDIDDAKVVVSEVQVDSILFSSGNYLWVVSGDVNYESVTENFQLFFSEHPLWGSGYPTKFKAPFGMDTPDECIFTHQQGQVRITWRNARQQISLKSWVTSGR